MKKRLLLLLMIFNFLINTSFEVNSCSKDSTPVLIYGIVYTMKCNSESYEFYTYKIVELENVYKEKEKLKASLEIKYANARRIRVSSSNFDHSISASNLCIIRWTKENNKCSYDVVSVAIDKTESAALNKAIGLKNLHGGNNSNYTILKQIFW